MQRTKGAAGESKEVRGVSSIIGGIQSVHRVCWSRRWPFIKSKNSARTRQRQDFIVVDIVGERVRQRQGGW